MSVWYLWSPALYSCLKSDLKNCTVHIIVQTALGKDEIPTVTSCVRDFQCSPSSPALERDLALCD